jgi:holliday junction DNA helicase RuvA
MIACVEGELLERGNPSLVMTGGIGLSVQLPETSLDKLPAVGERIRLWTHLSVREDGWTLFGFLDRSELVLFRLLITVNGVGPKVAMGILSGATAVEIANMLTTGNEKGLTRLPGIGAKSAARLVMELGAKVPAELMGDALSAAGGLPSGTVPTGERGTAVEMLLAMGLNVGRAEKVLDEALALDDTLAVDPVLWVRAALSRVS